MSATPKITSKRLLPIGLLLLSLAALTLIGVGAAQFHPGAGLAAPGLLLWIDLALLRPARRTR